MLASTATKAPRQLHPWGLIMAVQSRQRPSSCGTAAGGGEPFSSALTTSTKAFVVGLGVV